MVITVEGVDTRRVIVSMHAEGIAYLQEEMSSQNIFLSWAERAA